MINYSAVMFFHRKEKTKSNLEVIFIGVYLLMMFLPYLWFLWQVDHL